jgi:branched-chain amino acid transport system permease protein
MLLLEMGWSPFVTAPVAGVLGGLVGLLFGLVALRTRGPSFIIATIAMLLMVALLFDIWQYVGGANGMSLPLPPFSFEFLRVPFYYAMLLTAAGSTLLSWRVLHSRFGLGLRALAEDETKAEVSGIDTAWHKIAAFALSGIFPAIAGAIWGYQLTYLRGTIFFSIAVAAQMTLMAIIGGKGTVAGPVVGAVIIILLNEFAVARFGSSELNIVVTGVVLVLVLVFFPAGVIGSLRQRGRLPAFLDWD